MFLNQQPLHTPINSTNHPPTPHPCMRARTCTHTHAHTHNQLCECNVLFEGAVPANAYDCAVRLGQLARQFHVVVAQEIRPNCFHPHASELLPAASVAATAQAEPATALCVPALWEWSFALQLYVLLHLSREEDEGREHTQRPCSSRMPSSASRVILLA